MPKIPTIKTPADLSREIEKVNRRISRFMNRYDVKPASTYHSTKDIVPDMVYPKGYPKEGLLRPVADVVKRYEQRTGDKLELDDLVRMYSQFRESMVDIQGRDLTYGKQHLQFNVDRILGSAQTALDNGLITEEMLADMQKMSKGKLIAFYKDMGYELNHLKKTYGKDYGSGNVYSYYINRYLENGVLPSEISSEEIKSIL